MKTVIAALTIAIAANTAVVAETTQQYTLIPIEVEKTECTNTDIAIGAGIGVIGGAIIGVSSIIGAPVVGAAAGTTMTWGMAFSAPFLTNATASLATIGAVGAGPFVGTASYYALCVIREIY